MDRKGPYEQEVVEGGDGHQQAFELRLATFIPADPYMKR